MHVQDLINQICEVIMKLIFIRNNLFKVMGLVIFCALFSTSCWEDFNSGLGGTGKSSIPEVVMLESVLDASSVTFNWVEPDAVSYTGMKITYAVTGSPTPTEVIINKGTTSTVISLSSSEYTFTTNAIYSTGYESEGKTFKITPMAKPLRFIYTAVDLNNVNNNPGDYYVLMADIDLSEYSSGTGWNPIGNSGSPFSGFFEGNSHIISNLTINDTANNYKGLFGYANGAIIKNLDVMDVSVNGKLYVGGLAGYQSNGSITNCHVKGTVRGTQQVGVLEGLLMGNGTITNCSADGFSSIDLLGSGVGVGGLLGESGSSGEISYCHASVEVSGLGISSGGLVGKNTSPITYCYATGSVKGRSSAGGLVGYHYNVGAIQYCYSTGNVLSVAVDQGVYVGGLVGWRSSGTVSNCYAMGKVEGKGIGTQLVASGGFFGRLSGANPVQYCYNTGEVSASTTGTGTVYIGGFVGQSLSTITACYYDSDTTLQNDSGTGYTPKTSSEMWTQSTYQPGTNDWTFTATWSIDSTKTINSGYPYLTGMVP
jgi:hypothetical protein